MIALVGGAGAGSAGGGGIGGDPGAVEAAATSCDQGGTGLATVAQDLSSRVRELTSAWSGSAAEAAEQAITRLAQRTQAGADVVARVGPVLRTYAGELRAAQGAYAAASAQAGAAAQAGSAATAQQAGVDALRADDPTRLVAQQAAWVATDTAAGLMASAQGAVSDALERAARADQHAAAAIEALTGQLDAMDAAGAVAPAPRRSAAHPRRSLSGALSAAHMSWWDVAAWGEEAAVFHRVEPLGGQASRDFKNQVGGIGEGLWALGPGGLGALLSYGPSPEDQGTAHDIEAAHDWLQSWYGADTTSADYREEDIATQVVGALIPSTGWVRDAELATKASTAWQGARALLTREGETAAGDGAAGASAAGHAASNPSETDPPDTSTSPRAEWYEGYDPYHGLTKQDFTDKHWDTLQPTGRLKGPIQIPHGTNSPGEVSGRHYTGHAFDQMQGRGVPSSAVEDAITNGMSVPSRGGTTVHFSSSNNLSVVTSSDGRVVTVVTGDIR